MATVRQRVENRGRRVAASWQLLWLPASMAWYMLGAEILPFGRGAWESAGIWACYTAAWVVVVAIADGLLCRLRRKTAPSEAAAPRPRRLGWRIALYFGLFITASRLGPKAGGLYQLAVMAGAGMAIVFCERAFEGLARRREAERRRKEAAALARKF